MALIDIHTHGIGGYDTRTTTEEHILRIAEIHGSSGVSAIVPAVYSATVRVMRENMAVVKKAMERQKASAGRQEEGIAPGREGATGSALGTQASSCPPATILGVHLEGPFLNPSYCGALNAMTFIDPTEYALRELLEGFEDIVRIITVAPELENGVNIIRKITDMGIVASMGHSGATYSEAAAGHRAGARGITHLFNAMRGFHHREPGIAGFGLLTREVYTEIIADPHHLHSETLKLIFRNKDPERVLLVSDSVAETRTSPNGRAVTDDRGAPIGGSMTVAESAQRLMELGFGNATVARCMTENPLRYLERAA
ncbi:MAG: hypothetical protein ACM3ON_06615 [Chloroflexota bacterium]